MDYNRLPELRPGDARYARTVQVRFLGVAGFSFRLGDAQVLTAPFYSNPGLFRVLAGHIEPNVERILALAPKELGEVDALLVGHAHYDHLMDVPVLAKRRLPESCTIFGSRTAKHILAPEELPQRVKAVDLVAGTYRRPGKWHRVAAGRARVMALLSDHAPHFCGIRAFNGWYRKDLEKRPESAWAWRLGKPLAWLIDFMDASGERPVFRIYYQDTAPRVPLGLPPPLADGKRIDLAVLCVASFSQIDHHPEAIVLAARPRHVLLGHWEDFFRPQTEPLRPVPATDLHDFVERLEKVLPAAADYWLPAPGAGYRFEVQPR